MTAKKRVSIFEESGALDVDSFAPKTAIDATAPNPQQVRAVAQAANFKSREPAAAPNIETQFKRVPRRYRTGRNIQLNVKVSQETFDAFYAITEAHPGWVLGYTLERAVQALQRELENPA